MNDLLFLLIAVLPGFITVTVIRELVLSEPENKPIRFEFIVWSGFFSFFIYTILYLTILKNVPGVENISVFINDPQNLQTLIKIELFAILSAFLFGFVISIFIVRLGAINAILKRVHGREIIEDTVWDRVIDNSYRKIIIHTTDEKNNQYFGHLKNYSKKKQDKELFIENPYILEEKGFKKLEEINGILFLQNDIKRIEFLRKSDK